MAVHPMISLSHLLSLDLSSSPLLPLILSKKNLEREGEMEEKAMASKDITMLLKENKHNSFSYDLDEPFSNGNNIYGIDIFFFVRKISELKLLIFCR